MSVQPKTIMQTPYLVEDPAAAGQHDAVQGLVRIMIHEDGLKAFALTSPPRNGILNYSEQELRALLETHGVTHGIIPGFHNNIPVGNKGTTLVAQGRPPVRGRDATVQVRYTEARDAEHPNDSGATVDHRDVQSFIKVQPGEVIAEKIPATPGVPGLSVTGEPIPAASGNDILLIPGMNTLCSEDGSALVAAAAGVVRREDMRFDVINLCEIHGDVDYSVGNIDFEGCIIIHGDVLPGFKLAATEAIEVHGFVERASLEAGGDIRIRGGYYGDSDSTIKACGSLHVRSLENADVKVIRDIHVDKYIVNSRVICGGDVLVQDRRKGRVAGGHLTAGGDLHVCNLGSPSAVSTIVDFGNSVDVGTSTTHHFNMTAYYNRQLEKINAALATIRQRHLKKPLNAEETRVLHLLEGKARTCRENIRNLLRIHSSFILKKKQRNSAAISIQGTGYAGVQIHAAGGILDIKDDIENVVVRELTGAIVMHSWDQN